MEAAGFSEFPKDTAGFLELCKAMKAKGTPAGFAHGKAVGDGNNYVHWLLWSHGGKMVDETGKVAINSPETIAAHQLRQVALRDLHSGHGKLARHQQQPRLPGGPGLAHRQRRVALLCRQEGRADWELAADLRTVNFPIGPVGQSVELHQTTQAIVFNHTKFPNACKAYIKFMYEAEQMNAWIEGSSAYCCQPLKAFATIPSGRPIRFMRPMLAHRKRCGPTAMRARSAMHRPPSWQTMCWWTCSPPPSRAARLQRRRRTGRKARQPLLSRLT
jgi:multiple sugar transport system substrate-binding protein